MPQTATGRRRTPVLRVLGFLVAAALGVIGVWLIATGNSSKGVRIGAISAFWGLLIGTYAVFGSRVPTRATEPAPVPAPPAPSRELDIRQINEIERSAVAAARREFGEELHLMLRRELQAGFAQEVASLRSEVHALRSDLVEKVGGQLRLERIETTRLIGSDLEAVQSELRKLRETTHDADPLGPPRPESIPVSRVRPEIHDAEIVADPPAPPPPRAPEPPAQPPVAQPVARPVGQPDPDPARTADPLAGLPRLTPFTDFALDAPTTSLDAEPDTGRGRRHRADDGGNDILARILEREHAAGGDQ